MIAIVNNLNSSDSELQINNNYATTSQQLCKTKYCNGLCLKWINNSVGYKCILIQRSIIMQNAVSGFNHIYVHVVCSRINPVKNS